ncbi:MAG: ATP-binding cassette domain-containing protein [Clostridia bacterium]|nr:ATP-binding cassette domain-containing protein [Clostridia bacterium]
MNKNHDSIEIIGAAENNLKHIDVTIPKGRLVVFAGVSGSGKSSLAFDTVAVESEREWQQSYPLFIRNRMPHYDRPKVDEIRNLTPAIVVDQRPIGASSRSTVGTAVDAAPLMRLLFSRVGKPSAGGSTAYSFNHPAGACPDCTGMGEQIELDKESMFDPDRSLAEGAILFSQFSSGWQTVYYQNNPLLDPNKKLRDFSPEEWKVLTYGPDEPLMVEFKCNNAGRIDYLPYEGVYPRFERVYMKRDITKLKKKLQDEILTHVRRGFCRTCGGSGLNPKALASKINGKNIVDCMDMTAADLLPFLAAIDDPRGSALARQIAAYLERMIDAGVGYLSLSRRTDTLSGGEAQRLKIVRNLGGCLNNVTFIFDEPTAGLHPADAARIGRMLLELRERYNNVLVVEHSRQMIALADHVIELGPGAGTAGGEVVFAGTLSELQKADTPTAQAMAHKIALNRAPLPFSESYPIRDACCHNLRHVNVDIPKAVLTAVTGVAGSGKSSLMRYEFPKMYPGAIVIDQKPIGTSIRSTPATYTGVMDEIRRVFAKENGVGAGWFSFNSEGGCPVCRGTGQISYDMAFAEPVTITCEECGGRRYNPTALSYRYKGMNIEDVMALTIGQAYEFFDSAKIKKLLESMIGVGLDYLTLGQPTSTLSGGEIQRVKLASELHKKGQVYVLDEPSIGLHSKDTELLLVLLRRLVAGGNTVVMIEHRPEMIAQADWIIDMGPGGGSDGGEIVFEGTPEELVRCDKSKTGRALREMI